MKKILLSAAAIAALTVSASAADLGTSGYVDPGVASVDSSFDWTGFYLGVHGGFGGDKFSYPFEYFDDNGPSSFGGEADVTSSGFFGGGQIGGNWQTGNFVLGAVADIAWAGIDGEVSLDIEDLDLVTLGSSVEWFGTARVRAGFTPVDKLLVYGTGGFAYGSVEHSLSAFDGAIDESTSDVQTGWTVGGGFEYAVTQNITLFTEYLYVDLGDQELVNADFNQGDNFSLDADTKFHTVKAGVNFLW